MQKDILKSSEAWMKVYRFKMACVLFGMSTITLLMNISLQKIYYDYLSDKSFPCIGAKASLGKNESYCYVAGGINDSKEDGNILQFLYNFIDDFRNFGNDFYSVAIIFNDTHQLCEDGFEHLMWQRLQALSDLDAD